jgi:hypothetical protein
MILQVIGFSHHYQVRTKIYMDTILYLHDLINELFDAGENDKNKAEMKVLIHEYLTNYYINQRIHTKFKMTPLQFENSIHDGNLTLCK